MDDETLIGKKTKWAVGALGLGAVAGAFAIPKYGIWIALGILVLFILLFGGYFLWQRIQARRKRERFSSALEAQAGAAPKSISDPNKRAALDKLRQKFQQGLREFKSRGKDIYKLPWHVIIGEPGSGKSEAIRHSGVEFPPSMQDEMQGSGGTVNMDWWFTNRGIILDTAGSMIFNEAKAGESSEWKEFLRLLQKARPQCPINGLFLVLSIESLIKDSADTIASKASRLAQQLDLIQRTLDVRFPVYLLVTKCDLLTGFREFFDNIDDPTLQHQIFGWSNPDALDAPFRPELVEHYLKGMTDRLRRRRLALLREASPAGRLGGDTEMFFSSKPLGGAQPARKRLDEVDSMVALTDSIARLAPRLRRYLETIFVAGEWSAKPVFLRGIYFTSSMREGKALDEAIALATGLRLDEIPEDRTWQRDRAFFLRDLFVEKVFPESGLVTRATNTLQLLRKRQFAIFGTAGLALLLLLGFSGFGWHSLKKNIGAEAGYWNAGAEAEDWDADGNWSYSIVAPGKEDPFHYAYVGTNVVAGTGKLTIPEYHARLAQIASKRLSVGWIFKPMQWIAPGGTTDRKLAQRILFEQGVLKPLIVETRNKITRDPGDDPEALARYRKALLALIQFEADRYSTNGPYLAGTNAAARYLDSFLSFLTDTSDAPVDTNLVSVFGWTYSRTASEKGAWPPGWLSGGDSLAQNSAIRVGLETYRKANQSRQQAIATQVAGLNDLADALMSYHEAETNWLSKTSAWCPPTRLQDALNKVALSRQQVLKGTNEVQGPLTNLTAQYLRLEADARSLSEDLFQDIAASLPAAERTKEGLFRDIESQLREFESEAGRQVSQSFESRSNRLVEIDANVLAPAGKGVQSQFEVRYGLYTQACALASSPANVAPEDIGSQWARFKAMRNVAEGFRSGMQGYEGAYQQPVSNACAQIAGSAERTLQQSYVSNYVVVVSGRLKNLTANSIADLEGVAKLLRDVTLDLGAEAELGPLSSQLVPVRSALASCKQNVRQVFEAALARNARFPVVLSSASPMSAKDVRTFRNEVASLVSALKDPGLAQVVDSSAIAAVQRYVDVADGLIAEDGSAAEVEISLVMPAERGDDFTILTVFPEVRLSLGAEGTWKWFGNELELNRKSALATGKLDSPIKIEFRRSQNDPSPPPPTSQDNAWGMVRMLHLPDGKWLDQGLAWHVAVPLEDSTQGLKGRVTFEFRLKRPLPKPGDWPGK